jgi:Flp pilus assembly protein protease CpaA
MPSGVAQLDRWDLLILLLSSVCSCFIAYKDWQTLHFPLWSWALLEVLGIAWCVKQAFIPLSFFFLLIICLLIFFINRFCKPVVGNGDLLLFLSAGLFVPFDQVDLFLILCGIFAVLSYCAERVLRKNVKRELSFSPALLLAMMTSFLFSLFP